MRLQYQLTIIGSKSIQILGRSCSFQVLEQRILESGVFIPAGRVAYLPSGVVLGISVDDLVCVGGRAHIEKQSRSLIKQPAGNPLEAKQFPSSKLGIC